MKILLDEDESQKWLHMLECEKTLEKTSRFPPDMKLPAGCKMIITDSKRSEIISMHTNGMKSQEIADAVQLSVAQVRGCIGGHTKRKIKKYPSEEATAWIQEASQKLAANGSTKPIESPLEPTSESSDLLDADVNDEAEDALEAFLEDPPKLPDCPGCGKPMSGNDMVGYGGKIYCSAQCVPGAARQITVAESTTEEIKEALRTLVGDRYSVVYMMSKINREFGTNFTRDDIVKMRSEL
jgi:hypothetical protein